MWLATLSPGTLRWVPVASLVAEEPTLLKDRLTSRAPVRFKKKGACLTRRPSEDQYKYDNWSELRGVPWRLQAREQGQLRVDLPVVVVQPQRMPQQEVIPRNLYVLKSDIEKYGYAMLHAFVPRM